MRFLVDPERCVACLACVRVCPADAVSVVDETQVAIVDGACTRCGLCEPACPHDAIELIGDLGPALQLAAAGGASLILSVESAAHFYPATPEQVVNACYAAGFGRVHRGVIGDELVAREYLELWNDDDWGTLIRSTCPVVVETIRREYPELVPYLAPVATPVAAEARYLRAMFGDDLRIVYAGVCLIEGGSDVDAAITFAELEQLFRTRGVDVAAQPFYYDRVPDERARHWSTAGGLPISMLLEESQSSRRFRKVRGLEHLPTIARAVAVDRLDLGFVDLLQREGCLAHPLLGPKEELFWRRSLIEAIEPPRSPRPIVDDRVRVELGAAFRIEPLPESPAEAQIESVIAQIGLGPNGKPWDSGSCGYATCREFAVATLDGRTSLRLCPRYQERVATEAQRQASLDALTGLATFRVLRERLMHEAARSGRSGEPFAVLFLDLDGFKEVNDRYGHAVGNEVLQQVGHVLRQSVRTTDLAARYGGDEFVMVLVRTDQEGAKRVADALRKAIEGVGKRLGLPEVSASIGVAAMDPESGESQDLLVAADRALYQAKAAGRNVVL